MVNAKTAKNAKVAQGMQEDNGNGFQKYLQKTKMCNFHVAGKCRAGANCAFAHEDSELSKMPDLEKTQLCTAFKAGNCRKENCRYAHGLEELRNSEFFFKRMPCKFYSQGKCQNGKTCRFAHGSHELLQSSPAASGPPTSTVVDSSKNKVASSKAKTEKVKKGASKTPPKHVPDRVGDSDNLLSPAFYLGASSAGPPGDFDETDDCWNLLPNIQTNFDLFGLGLPNLQTDPQDPIGSPMKIALPNEIQSWFPNNASDLDLCTPCGGSVPVHYYSSILE